MLLEWPNGTTEYHTFASHLVNLEKGGFRPDMVKLDGTCIDQLLNMNPEDMRQTLIRIRKALD